MAVETRPAAPPNAPDQKPRHAGATGDHLYQRNPIVTGNTFVCLSLVLAW
jgi:hypothetical protein